MTGIAARIDQTHDPELESWVESANDPATDCPVQNLPLGVLSRRGATTRWIGVAIGTDVLDLGACVAAGFLDALDEGLRTACQAGTLNHLAGLGRAQQRELRHAVSALLRADTTEGSASRARSAELLEPASNCVMALPVNVGDYTDFYASIHHATNVGAMFRPDSPLLPNYRWVPIGYHGRASSIVVSGTPVVRPHGQTRRDSSAPPAFGPTTSLDYELELGAFIGRGNALGERVHLSDAEDHLFGLCLVNDWSARDIQSWEYQPLGPFLAKNFATSVSPWVITLDALEPFRAPRAARAPEDPGPLPHLDGERDATGGAFDITLEVRVQSTRMRQQGTGPVRVSQSSFRDMYWTIGQMLVHHASNGCNLRPGDLIASGTVSGTTRDAQGCLLEITRRGAEPLELPGGERRAFLEDGDEVTLSGWCERPGFRRIGFGECGGMVQPAMQTEGGNA